MGNELTVLLGALVMLLFGRYTNRVLDHIEPRIARGAANTARNIFGVARRRNRDDLERMALLAAFGGLVVIELVQGEYFTLGLLVASGTAGFVVGRLRSKYISGYWDLCYGVAVITSMSAALVSSHIRGEVNLPTYVLFVFMMLFGGSFVVTGVRALRARVPTS